MKYANSLKVLSLSLLISIFFAPSNTWSSLIEEGFDSQTEDPCTAQNLHPLYWPDIKKSKICILNLDQNNLSPQELKKLVTNLQGTLVHTISLWGNDIGDQGAKTLAIGLQKTPVKSLNIGWNKISDQGAKSFAKELKQTIVNTVDLHGNNIFDHQTKEFLRKEYPHINWIF